MARQAIGIATHDDMEYNDLKDYAKACSNDWLQKG